MKSLENGFYKLTRPNGEYWFEEVKNNKVCSAGLNVNNSTYNEYLFERVDVTPYKEPTPIVPPFRDGWYKVHPTTHGVWIEEIKDNKYARDETDFRLKLNLEEGFVFEPVFVLASKDVSDHNHAYYLKGRKEGIEDMIEKLREEFQFVAENIRIMEAGNAAKS